MKRDITRQQQVIKNAVAVLNGDLGEEARRCFLVFLKAQKRAERHRARRSTLILPKLRDGSPEQYLVKDANTSADVIRLIAPSAI